MCGRFVTPEEAEIERFWHIGRHNWHSPFERVRHARFNVAPQQGNPKNYILVVRADLHGTLELTDLQWWLLPSWSEVPATKYSTFNARVETAEKSASFREAFKYRRCLIPAKGWYEWQVTPAGKQPWYFHSADGAMVAFAGLWERWEHGGQIIESCAIVVGEANAAVRQIHDRMPILMPQACQMAWLSHEVTDPREVRTLLRPPDDAEIAFHRVSTAVGNASHDRPELIDPAVGDEA